MKRSEIQFKRHPANPYRDNSGYSTIFNIISSRPGGISRAELVVLASRITGKDLKRSRYDVAIILTASDSRLGYEPHRSARFPLLGFTIVRDCDHVRLCPPPHPEPENA